MTDTGGLDIPAQLPLAALVDLVNDREDPMPDREGPGVTLSLGGVLLAGEVIPAWQWIMESGEGEAPGAASRVWQVVTEEFEALVASSRAAKRKPEGAWSDEERWSVAQRNSFIHLRDAYILNSLGNEMNARGMYWQVRTAAVDAWAYGHMLRD
jgi:hypothetical protein